MRWFWGILLAFAPLVSAQQAGFPIINEIELQDLTRVSESLIRSQLESRVGEPYSPRAVARDIRRISDMQYFTNVEVYLDQRDGRTILVYQFVEERTIAELVIAGNKKVKERDIRGVLNHQEGDAYFEEAFEGERELLMDLLHDKGFLNATVDITTEQVGETGMRVSYFISEGRRARIKKLKFDGNENISNRKLRRKLKTGDGFLFFKSRYKEDVFEQDLAQIVAMYGNIGRLEARVLNTEFNYTRDGKRVVITFNIEEGPEYTMASLGLDGNIVFTEGELIDLTEVGPGDVHNKGQVDGDAQAIQELYSDSGYLYSGVQPLVTLDRENHTTNVIHRINEDQLRYIGAVTITGNSVTKDEVIRRNVLLEPGDRYDGSLLDTSLNRLGQTRYFEEVRRSMEAMEDDRFINLLLDVDPGKTSTFNFGAGFNTDSGIGGFGELRFNNFDITNPPTFSGGGQSFSIMANIGNYDTEYRLSFTDPQIAGYPLSLGVDLFDSRYESRGGSDYVVKQQGARLRLGKRLSNTITARTYLSYADVSFTNLETFVDPGLRVLQDPEDTVLWGWSISRDSADHFLDPTSGSRIEFYNEWAGFVGENEFAKAGTDATYFFKVPGSNSWTFSLNNRIDIAEPLGDDEYVPLAERFFAGGSTTIRGYDSRDVGPKAKTFKREKGKTIVDKEAIGGEFRLLNTLEFKYKLNDTLRFYAFGDGGGVWMDASDFEVDDMKYSVGVGLGMNIPFLGPLRVDYGFPLNPDDDQGSGQLHLQTLIGF